MKTVSRLWHPPRQSRTDAPIAPTCACQSAQHLPCKIKFGNGLETIMFFLNYQKHSPPAIETTKLAIT